MKDQFINYLRSILTLKKVIQGHIGRRKKHTQRCSKNVFFTMYLEHLAFVISRGGWCVTKIYSHFTFEQEAFKKNYILMNQKSRQNAKNSIEKDFFKLINNSNFGYDCRNNLDNCQFIPIFDELKEVTYHKRYYNYFEQKVSKFVTADLIKQEIDEIYNDSLMKLSKDDTFYEIKLSSIETERAESLEAAEKYEKRTQKKRTLYDYVERHKEA